MKHLQEYIYEHQEIDEGLFDWFTNIFKKASNSIKTFIENTHRKPSFNLKSGDLKYSLKPITKIDNKLKNQLKDKNLGFSQFQLLTAKNDNDITNNCNYVVYTFDIAQNNDWVTSTNLPMGIIGWYRNVNEAKNDKLKLCILEVSEYVKDPKIIMEAFKEYLSTNKLSNIKYLVIDINNPVSLPAKEYTKLGFDKQKDKTYIYAI